MYKFDRYRQLGLTDLDQLAGLKMNVEHRWVKRLPSFPGKQSKKSTRVFFPARFGLVYISV